ncbi:MAG TPA: hypothetical protein VLA97_18545 [Nocardioidaceae bacterium]|nr:hypothetical protein [Nocardioidaceae bacterium]
MPRLYRLIVSAVAIVVFAAAGIWAAIMFPYPRLISVGATIGLALGVLCTYLLLHQFHNAPDSQPVRRTRR